LGDGKAKVPPDPIQRLHCQKYTPLQKMHVETGLFKIQPEINRKKTKFLRNWTKLSSCQTDVVNEAHVRVVFCDLNFVKNN